MNKIMKCDWIRYMNKRAEIPIIRKRETPAPQVHVILSKYLVNNK